MPEVRIREYRPEDLEGLFALDCLCFDEVYRFSRRAMRRFAEAREAISLVAVDTEGSLAGFAIVQVEGPGKGRYGYVVTLDVAPEGRRSGLASRLMAEAERRVTARGAEAMALHVAVENEAAVRFYQRAGYERVGAEAGYYGAGLDAWVFTKTLDGDLLRA